MSLSSGERELKSDFTQASEQVRGSLSSGERELRSVKIGVKSYFTPRRSLQESVN